MKQILSKAELDLIEDYREILAEAEKLKTEISKTKTFLIKFDLTTEFETIFKIVNKFKSNLIFNRTEATLYYLYLKIALIDLQLIVNDNQLNANFEIYHQNPAIFDRLIQCATITPENRHEIVKNLVLYLAFKPEHQAANFSLFTQNSNN